ncbi:MAG: hypothetical protein QY326_01435 [Bdellovibrionota bacterium]|nr:MAG: hypothetical protein QY326_01435 [Bdellovibrionota bacterium]
MSEFLRTIVVKYGGSARSEAGARLGTALRPGCSGLLLVKASPVRSCMAGGKI